MSEHPNPVTFLDTELRPIWSSQVGDEFSLYVGLPPGYASSQQRYPVLYLLDGDVWFGVVTDTLRVLKWGEEAPEMLVVGIAYGMDKLDNRNRDFTPAPVADVPNSGGAAAFARFLHDDIIPFVDANYRTIPAERLLVGVSLGGIFATYFMFHYPGTFDRYMLLSPGVEYEDRIMFREEATFVQQGGILTGRLFASVGSEETDSVQDLKDFVAVLRSREAPGLELHMATLDGETHFSQGGRAFTTGIRTLYRR